MIVHNLYPPQKCVEPPAKVRRLEIRAKPQTPCGCKAEALSEIEKKKVYILYIL